MWTLSHWNEIRNLFTLSNVLSVFSRQSVKDNPCHVLFTFYIFIINHMYQVSQNKCSWGQILLTPKRTYFSGTLCILLSLGFQTLGEEYTGIIQVAHGYRRIPSLIQRLLMIFLHSFGPHILKALLKKAKTRLLDKQENDERKNEYDIKFITMVNSNQKYNKKFTTNNMEKI